MERGNELDLNYPGYWFNKWEHLIQERLEMYRTETQLFGWLDALDPFAQNIIGLLVVIAAIAMVTSPLWRWWETSLEKEDRLKKEEAMKSGEGAPLEEVTIEVIELYYSTKADVAMVVDGNRKAHLISKKFLPPSLEPGNTLEISYKNGKWAGSIRRQ